MNKLTILSLAVVLAVAVGGYFFPNAVRGLLGSACNGGNCTNYSAISVSDGYYINDVLSLSSTVANLGLLTQGGGVTATSSAASATILASSFDTENAFEVSLPVGAVTLTLPASTTFPLGTTPGSYRQFTMFNASTTDGAIITIAGNTGTLLEVASSTIATGLKTVAPSGVAIFTAFRKANSDIEVFMNPGQ
jgi:hypothetical protein